MSSPVHMVGLKLRAAAREPENAYGKSLGFILSVIQFLIRADRRRDLLGTRSCEEACIVQLGDTVRNDSMTTAAGKKTFATRAKGTGTFPLLEKSWGGGEKRSLDADERQLLRRQDPYDVHRRGCEGVFIPIDSEAGSKGRVMWRWFSLGAQRRTAAGYQ